MMTHEPFSGGEHKAKDTVDHKKRKPPENEVEPTDPEVGFFLHRVKSVEIDEQRHNLAREKNPLGGPAENIGVDEERSGGRVEQGDRKPDCDTGDGAKNHGQQNKKCGMPLGKLKDRRGVFADAFDFGQNQKQPPADGKMRHIDVDYGDYGY